MSASEKPEALPISEYAIIVDKIDNVAVVKQEPAPGTQIEMPDGRVLTITGAVTPGHRFATRTIAAGEYVLQYGQPIGTSLGIAEGEPISHANMANEVPVVRDLPDDLHTPPPDYFSVELSYIASNSCSPRISSSTPSVSVTSPKTVAR